MTPADLRPGDALLYRPSSIFGWLIRRHTGFPISHVEVYIGGGQSLASRDGIGTGRYPLRLAQLQKVCRPRVLFDTGQALAWFTAQPHQPYGWLDLLDFFDFNVNGPGIVCSPFATLVERAGGVNVFPGIPAQKIAPFAFELDSALTVLPWAAEGV